MVRFPSFIPVSNDEGCERGFSWAFLVRFLLPHFGRIPVSKQEFKSGVGLFVFLALVLKRTSCVWC